ncbi:hypothetical protein MTO96_005152 [Rhipicephalus appendiculatus]
MGHTCHMRVSRRTGAISGERREAAVFPWPRGSVEMRAILHVPCNHCSPTLPEGKYLGIQDLAGDPRRARWVNTALISRSGLPKRHRTKGGAHRYGIHANTCVWIQPSGRYGPYVPQESQQEDRGH